ncbi:hypothetical protein JR316_0010271 [Psilocybe cubensis]|uniref:Uncharacterized protein n=2 Tax=Psilocybe cubensis TaxID=181762 RepID=A0ACB8GRD8_PSICU|nr:hypothetical protein JR316_0010271 [Psilocybe cubensis]KAH9478035.1 hypothetical protein JR316_0010271 [Psilocybe cubensis]
MVDSGFERITVMDGKLEPLEKIFQQLEEESERKAQEQLMAPNSDDSPERPTSSLAIKRIRERRRGSISISRIGQLPEEMSTAETKGPTTPTLMKITSNSPFYQAQIANGSTDSIASGASAYSNDHAHTEDDNHVTQMHHIAGRPSISSKMIPRRLSRSQSTGVIPPPRGVQNMESTVIIDVSVQEATVESEREEDGAVVTRSRRTSIQAAGSLRHQSSRLTIPPPKVVNGAGGSSTGWLSKAKNFTLRFSRKNRPSIPVQHVES